MKLSRIATSAALSVFTFAAQAQEIPASLTESPSPADLYEGKAYINPFDCSNPHQLVGEEGPLGSQFANAYWGNMECGNPDIADAVLDSMPAPETAMQIPGVKDVNEGGEIGAFAKCYFGNMPFGAEDVVRTRDILDGTVTENYGPYALPEKEFGQLHRVIANICTFKPS